MTITAFYAGLLLTVLVQPGARSQRVDSSFQIFPSKLQVLEYESLSFQCDGFDTIGWKVMRRTKTKTSPCGFSNWGALEKSSCTIKDAFVEDSGEYWCEAEGGERSNSVNIAVSTSVILEIPARPVREGESVTLRCKNKVMLSNLTADFYRNNLLIQSSSTTEVTLRSVSMCDRGFYKCRIEKESPESWLAVKAQCEHSHDTVDVVFLVFRDVLPIVLMILILLLLAELNGWRFRDAELSNGLSV